MKEITLGSVVRDTVTLFEGTATARSIHLHGCDRYWVQPSVDKDGKNRDGMWIDRPALEVLIEAETAPVERKTGGFNSTIK